MSRPGTPSASSTAAGTTWTGCTTTSPTTSSWPARARRPSPSRVCRSPAVATEEGQRTPPSIAAWLEQIGAGGLQLRGAHAQELDERLRAAERVGDGLAVPERERGVNLAAHLGDQQRRLGRRAPLEGGEATQRRAILG